jgi:hypothetical protein
MLGSIKVTSECIQMINLGRSFFTKIDNPLSPPKPLNIDFSPVFLDRGQYLKRDS